LLLALEVDTAQDNTWRSAFELHCKEFASGTLFNPIAESDELGLTLVRLGPRRAFQMVHADVEIAQGISLWPSAIENSTTILSNS
jgi:hypothetical protein